jgi:glutamyl-Q tRNA(Asp) synthetase
MTYIGRFAPSPTGPLHAGSLVAAMASYLDAKAHHGTWLVRIEDIDEDRSVAGVTENILHTLQALGMQWDGEVVCQSQRKPIYEAALQKLASHTYVCGCTRKEIADSRSGIGSDGADIYPGTCRNGLAPGKMARAIRLRVPDPSDPDECITFEDRWLGHASQHLATQAGDFVLKRADGFHAYQLAVVVDDAAQGVTDIVRGVDLFESTVRQIYLQWLLGVPTPRYLHVPVVVNDAGEKLSKQTGAQALDLEHPVKTLLAAATFLELPIQESATLEEFWGKAIQAWSIQLAK